MKKTTLISAAAALAAVLCAPAAARAADDGELWEITSKMDMPDMPQRKHRAMPEGMPAGMMGAMGMGEHTQKICRGNDPREEITKNKEMKDCKVDTFKDADNKVTMTAVCKKGRSAKMEIVFNKDRSSYKGTMHMTDEGRTMEMAMTGRKIGPCDAKKARDERTATAAKYKAQADASQAQYKEMTQKAADDQIKACSTAVEKMDPEGLGIYGSCAGRKGDSSCQQIKELSAKQQPKVSEACSAKSAELCRRYQTQEGFVKASRDQYRLSKVAEMCGVQPSDVRAKLCPAALKSESYEFIGASCPEQAKPLAKAHCAGKSYTVKEGDPRRVEKKWFKFCTSVAGVYASEADDSEQAEERPAKHRKAAEDPKAAVKEALTPDKAVDAGINKLKGLFGR